MLADVGEIGVRVDKSLARGLSTRTLKECLDQAQTNWAHLERILTEATVATASGRPVSKVATRLGRELSIFFRRSTVFGEMVWFSQRRAGYIFMMPMLVDEGLRFTMALGDVNGRGFVETPELLPLLHVSHHAMARLHQRMNTTDIDVVLGEIYHAIFPALKMKQAALATKSLFWPLIGLRGIFVTTDGSPAEASTVVTWLPLDGLSPKWQRVVDDLRRVPDFREPWLENEHACAAVLSRHAWLREPHSGSADREAEW